MKKNESRYQLICLRVIILVNLCLLPFLLSGCDALYRMLDKEGAEEKEIVGEVIPFEKNPTIEEVQILLKLYGYESGRIDGVIGRRTRDAIERFQRDHGLKETRFVDAETWLRLRVFKDNGFIVDGKLSVVFVQKILNAAGFNAGPEDGKLGPKTKKAILTFQKANGLKVDGRVGYQTLSKMGEYMETEK